MVGKLTPTLPALVRFCWKNTVRMAAATMLCWALCT